MASPQKSSQDELMRYKQAERERKMKEKEIKRQQKMQKREAKRQKKLEKMRRKMAKKGIILPEPSTTPDSKPVKDETKAKKTTTAKVGEGLPEAEVITGEADVWVPQSARNIDEIQKRIDRMDRTKIQNLKERYKKRYGEDLEIPDAYNVKSSIELDTAEKSGEIEGVSTSEDDGSVDVLRGTSTDEGLKTEKKGGLGFGSFGSKVKKGSKTEKSTEKSDRPVRFLDLRTPLFILKKFSNEETSGGKKAILAIIDILILILIPLTIIRIITTPIYIMKDRKEERLIQEIGEQSSSVKTTS